LRTFFLSCLLASFSFPFCWGLFFMSGQYVCKVHSHHNQPISCSFNHFFGCSKPFAKLMVVRTP
jgi:hypothetical protein